MVKISTTFSNLEDTLLWPATQFILSSWSKLFRLFAEIVTIHNLNSSALKRKKALWAQKKHCSLCVADRQNFSWSLGWTGIHHISMVVKTFYARWSAGPGCMPSNVDYHIHGPYFELFHSHEEAMIGVPRMLFSESILDIHHLGVLSDWNPLVCTG